MTSNSVTAVLDSIITTIIDDSGVNSDDRALAIKQQLLNHFPVLSSYTELEPDLRPFLSDEQIGFSHPMVHPGLYRAVNRLGHFVLRQLAPLPPTVRSVWFIPLCLVGTPAALYPLDEEQNYAIFINETELYLFDILSQFYIGSQESLFTERDFYRNESNIDSALSLLSTAQSDPIGLFRHISSHILAQTELLEYVFETFPFRIISTVLADASKSPLSEFSPMDSSGWIVEQIGKPILTWYGYDFDRRLKYERFLAFLLFEVIAHEIGHIFHDHVAREEPELSHMFGIVGVRKAKIAVPEIEADLFMARCFAAGTDRLQSEDWLVFVDALALQTVVRSTFSRMSYVQFENVLPNDRDHPRNSMLLLSPELWAEKDVVSNLRHSSATYFERQFARSTAAAMLASRFLPSDLFIDCTLFFSVTNLMSMYMADVNAQQCVKDGSSNPSCIAFHPFLFEPEEVRRLRKYRKLNEADRACVDTWSHKVSELGTSALYNPFFAQSPAARAVGRSLDRWREDVKNS